MKSEIIARRDPASSRTVRQLTSYKGNSHHLYFTNPGWWDNGRRLLFGSDRAGRTNLFSVELESGEITQHTDADMPGPPRETNFLFAAVNPLRPECYFWRGEELRAIDLKENRERLLARCPARYLPNMLNVSADGRHLYTVIYEDLSDRFPLDLMNNYVGFNEYFEAHPHSQIIRFPVDGGAVETVWEERHWIGHVNTSPTQSHLLSFCHEGPWEKVDNRIWVFDIGTGKVRPVRARQVPGEYVGHEYWHADGVTLGYHGKRPGAEGFFGAIRYDDTGMEECAVPGETGHVHSDDFSLVVGDGEKVIRLWGKAGDHFEKPRLLCRQDSTWKTQQAHPHPRFSPDRKKVIFTSDRSGYCQVYEVEVGDWASLPFVD